MRNLQKKAELPVAHRLGGLEARLKPLNIDAVFIRTRCSACPDAVRAYMTGSRQILVRCWIGPLYVICDLMD